MLSSGAQARFCGILLNISEEEREIEVIRQVLCELTEFEPYAAFIRIDRYKQGFLTALDIQQFLLSNNINYSESDCFYFIQQYDKDFDNRLVFAEFLYSVLPQDNPDLRTLASQRPNYNVRGHEYLTHDLEYTLSKLIRREIELGIQIHSKINELTLQSDFSLQKAFNTIDFERIQFLDFENLRYFFKQCNVLPFDEEIICLLRRLDINDDGRLTYEEFEDRFKARDVLPRPISPGRIPQITKEYSADQTLVSSQLKNRLENSPAKYTSTIQQQQQQSPRREIIRQIQARPSPTQQQQQQVEQTATSQYSGFRRYESPVRVITEERRRISPVRVYRPVDQQTLITREYSPIRRTIDRYTPEKNIESQAVRTEQRIIQRDSPERVVSFQERQKVVTTTTTTTSNRVRTTGLNQDVANALKQFINLDGDLELAKQNLVNRPDFNLLDGFRLLDYNEKGIVTQADLELALQDLGIILTRDQLQLFIKKYDTSHEGRIRYSDFADAFTPIDKESSTILLKKQPKGLSKISEVFDAETRKLFVGVLRLLIENETQSEEIRQGLNRNQDFNVNEVFLSIDIENEGLINASKLKTSLNSNGIFPTDREISYLVNRFTTKHDGRITYSEFSQEFTPRIPSSRYT